MASGQELAVLSGHSSSVNTVVFSPDGTTLASASSDQSIKIWDIVSRKQLAIFSGHLGAVLSVVFSPDGQTLASAKLWNISSLALMRKWVQENRYIREFTCEERQRFNMPVQCDYESNFATRTP